MSYDYDNDDLSEDQNFRLDMDEESDDDLEGMLGDEAFELDEEEDPDNRYH